MSKVPVILTIAGSDSGGGAGIEADIKTISTLGLHPACAITSVTSQNTTGVLSAYDIPCEVIKNQADAVCKDMNIQWAKSGMLSSSAIISTVADIVKEYDLKLVVDPVMAAEAGGDLLRKDAISTLKEELLPISQVVTPNINEANILSGMQITNTEEAKQAAKVIARTGVRIVIITGGHLDATDIIYDSANNTYTMIPGTFVKGGTHGSGCTYSSALASYLAQGYSTDEAAKMAKGFVVDAIEGSLSIGKGVGPVNQLSHVLHSSEKYNVLHNMKEAVEILRERKEMSYLIPEVGCNIAMAVQDATQTSEVAAVTGRIVRVRDTAQVVGDIEFGASSHVARIILAAMKHEPGYRASVNIRYSEELVDICRELNFSIASFSREEEPEDTHTMDWGTTDAIQRHGSVPDIIYDKGGVGKEPMIRVMGHNATEVANSAIKIAERYSAMKDQ
ncbi:bifunctional hydroxymethylpyrimidine kinase/phosphomethylpyrimidine kinase [Methanolobus profundi]|uniref:Hydroxymethylpyrimidine/phosphomethylpyrimidine kinase n=1 Tax=Methanolobus profundi TaxID=487685 RepID=A0A1I4NU64_9EURY|nr:bifunctional hydroxymethylpyrimidine kinase/phosphomethylpyrimidine kinase [Methanolobus profundi]SFM18890.1 hydroxymethylpyrimidine/phosphomethylpyrimidine kinase [Methanolobus profundi]